MIVFLFKCIYHSVNTFIEYVVWCQILGIALDIEKK
jgi:hypothetical protein